MGLMTAIFGRGQCESKTKARKGRPWAAGATHQCGHEAAYKVTDGEGFVYRMCGQHAKALRRSRLAVKVERL